MGLFGFGGDDTSIQKSEMPEEYRTGFRRGQEFGYEELGASRRTGEEQAQLAAALLAQTEGRAPSLAAMQYARALEQSQAATASQLASARGLSPAQAQQMLMTQQAAARQAAAGQSAMMRLQEQQAAQGMLGTLLGQRRQFELLGGQVAGQLGTQAGQLGMSQQELEQRRLEQETALRIDLQKEREAAIAQAAGSVLSGWVPWKKSAHGGPVVPGKAKYKGDTRSNDTVPALLSPGEIVLPRTVAQSPDAPEKAHDFVAALKKKKKPTPKDYMAALSRLEDLEARLNAMEALQDLEAEERG